VNAFVDRVAAGGSALDPEAVARMLGRWPPDDPLRALTREHAVAAAMAEGKIEHRHRRDALDQRGRSRKHVTAIFRKLGITPASTERRSVHAALAYGRRSESRR
jgi:hypothetical protein